MSRASMPISGAAFPVYQFPVPDFLQFPAVLSRGEQADSRIAIPELQYYYWPLDDLPFSNL